AGPSSSDPCVTHGTPGAAASAAGVASADASGTDTALDVASAASLGLTAAPPRSHRAQPTSAVAKIQASDLTSPGYAIRGARIPAAPVNVEYASRVRSYVLLVLAALLCACSTPEKDVLLRTIDGAADAPADVAVEAGVDSGVDPTLGGPCIDDTQCDDKIA